MKQPVQLKEPLAPCHSENERPASGLPHDMIVILWRSKSSAVGDAHSAGSMPAWAL